LQPQRCTLSNGGQLRRLKVRKAQRGQITILSRESGEAVDHDRKFLENESEGSADEDEVRVAAIRNWKIRKASECIGSAYSVT
jgi:hypothetical protein